MKRLLILCLIFPVHVFSQDSAISLAPTIGFRFYTENDFFSPLSSNKDDNYTGGLRVEIVTNLLNCVFRPRILNPSKWYPLQQNLSLNATAFTPRDLADSNIVRTDRPYASYQHVGVGAGFLAKDQKKKYSYELLVGQFGRAMTGKAQKYGHRKLRHCFGFGRPEPAGWHHQIADGGAWAFNLRLNHYQILSRTEVSERKTALVAIWRNEVNLGQYITNLSTGVRIMFIPKKASPLIQGEPEISVPAIKPYRARIYGYITPKVKGVLHNVTLTGKYLSKSSVHTIHPTNISRFLFEYDAGIQWNPGRWQLGYVLMGRGKEFEQQVKTFHHWGGFYFGYMLD